jgi:hypothetical protein
VFVLGGILVAGLWPFHAPKNAVSWLRNKNGLLFGDYGSILSSGEFAVAGSQGQEPRSIEIWLQPGLVMDSNTFLAFYTPENLGVPLSFHQCLTNLVVQREVLDQQHHAKILRIGAEHVFRENRDVFITITSSTRGTALYVDGNLVNMNPNFGLAGKDLIGRLVVGNSPTSNDSWSGQLRGIGIYNQELTPAQVVEHYNTWSKDGRPRITDKESVIGLYLFNEHEGSVVYNQTKSGIDIYIPERYQVFHKPFLEWPWNEFRFTWSYGKDIVINVGGFIPLGFFFCAYFSSVRRMNHAAAATIALGFAVSLTIEVLQAFLPTRDSGMTDIFTNTSGTALGAWLYGWISTHTLLGKADNRMRSAISKKTETVCSSSR